MQSCSHCGRAQIGMLPSASTFLVCTAAACSTAQGMQAVVASLIADTTRMQAKDVAASLKKFNFQHVYISPFYRTIQTARFAAEGLGIEPSKWTISCLVAEVR